MVAHPDGSIWFVQTKVDGLGRIDREGAITEFRVARRMPRCAASPWRRTETSGFTENFANKIGRMSPTGEVIGEYPIPVAASGPRAIVAVPDGRLFFSAYDAGAIGEVIPRRGR